MKEFKAEFNGIKIIPHESIMADNYRFDLSYKTVLVYRDDENIGCFYPSRFDTETIANLVTDLFPAVESHAEAVAEFICENIR